MYDPAVYARFPPEMIDKGISPASHSFMAVIGNPVEIAFFDNDSMFFVPTVFDIKILRVMAGILANHA
jgi:hypothetical protein